MAGKTTRVVMPQLGESVHEGTISKWLVKPGDKVVEFEPMLEVDTDKVNAEVPAPVSGILREILAKEGETVQAGAEIAVVETGGGASEKLLPTRGEVAAKPPEGLAKTEIRRLNQPLRLLRSHLPVNGEELNHTGTPLGSRWPPLSSKSTSRGSPAPASAAA